MKHFFRTLSLMIVLSSFMACRFSSSKIDTPFRPSDPSVSLLEGFIKDPGGKPSKGAYVYAYEIFPDGDLPQLRDIADYKSTAADESGHYSLVVPLGSYVFIARKRKGPQPVGPITPNDFSSNPSLPLRLTAGEVRKENFTVYSLKRLNEGYSLSSFFNYEKVLYGRVENENGLAAQGLVIVAGKRKKLTRKPDFTSLPTDVEGKYFLPLGGDYGKTTFFIEVRRGVVGNSCLFSSGKKWIEVAVSSEDPYKRQTLILRGKSKCSPP